MRKISEMFASSFSWLSFQGMRSAFRLVGSQFWPKSHPRSEGTVVNYDLCRTMYRNSGDNALGAGFAKPIVDLQVGIMGLPTVTVQNENLDSYLNDCLNIYWIDEIQQMFRDAIRDSKVVVKICKPEVMDPLMTMEEAQHCRLEMIPPERVQIERNFQNKHIIDRAIILNRMIIVTDEGDIAEGREPVEEEHDVLEIIDRDRYRYFDQNTHTWLTDLETPNASEIVPLVEVFNEWESYLQGGQSDLEAVIPFIQAFHDVLAQGLQAHKYHSTPKVKLKLTDVAPFIANNFPEAWDAEAGRVKSGSEVSWRGREIIFLQAEDDMSFLEAKSVLGDTKTIAEFLIDCICIASQTPEWAFMRVDSGSANSDRNAQTVPFIHKIGRKRNTFAKAIQDVCKIALIHYGELPLRARVNWTTIRADDQVVVMQAFQQLVMGLEVARQRGEISDDTYQNMLREFLPMMGSNASEKSTPDPPALPAPPPGQPQIRSGA